jgi:hypothetical protein
MTRSDGGVDTRLIVGSIADEGSKWTWDLLEQGPDLRAIIDIMGRQLRGEDLSRLRIDTDVQLSPGSAPAGAVILCCRPVGEQVRREKLALVPPEFRPAG